MVPLKKSICLAYLLFASTVIGSEGQRVLWSLSNDERDTERDTHRLGRRQITEPPATTQPECDDGDGFFYTTPRSTTFQLQCKTNYDGKVLGQTVTSNYTDCVLLCEQLNLNVAPGFCVGITFNSKDDTASGNCTGYTQISKVSKLDSNTALGDSALLIYGPDGNQYAAPAGDEVSTLMLAASSVGTTEAAILSVLASPTIVQTTDDPTTASHGTLISISIAGPRPVDIITNTSRDAVSSSPTDSDIISVPRITSKPTASRPNVIQATITSIISYTIYKVQVIDECQTPSSNCLTRTTTSTELGYRTQISCSPGLCDGIMLVSNVTASFLAPTCIVPY